MKSSSEIINESVSDTKLKMADALKTLIAQKSFSKITVGDIVYACEINRNTFYYHFENTYDLLYFTYEQEVGNIVRNFRSANATLPQALDIILEYIDSNILLCQCAYESLGENELKNIFERDLTIFVTALIDFFLGDKQNQISEDFKSFIIFSYTGTITSQIVWYIKYNENLDKIEFKEYIKTIFYVSLESVIRHEINKG